MLYQPTNIYPSMTGSLGNGVVDAAKDLPVTWQVNGNSAMVAYQITIYRNNAASTQVYTTGKQTQGCPFYGVDAAGNVQFFSYTIAAAALSGAGITNGGEYKLVIKQWWGSTDAQSVTQTSASAFITRAAPVLAVTAFSDPLAVREYTFSADYTQAQGDSLNWVRWQFALVDTAGEYETLRDTGKIYGTGELKFTYDGMFAGSRYAVRCSVQTQNGVEADTGWQEFAVEYTTEIIPGTLTACATRQGVRLTFPPIKSLPAEITGSYEVEDSYLRLPEGSKAVWDTEDGEPMALSGDGDIVWRGKADAEGTVLKVTGDGTPATFTMGKTPAGSSSATDQTGCAYGAGVYVIAGGNGGFYWSEDLVSWTTVKTGVSALWSCLYYGGGKFVAFSFATNGTSYVGTSTDGKTWTTGTVKTTDSIVAVCYGRGMYLAIGTRDILVCEDGETWQSVPYPDHRRQNGDYGSLAFDGSMFIVPLGYLYKTRDGRSWSVVLERECYHVCYANGIYVATQSGRFVYRSTDLATWEEQNLSSTARVNLIYQMTYGGGYFLACVDFLNGQSSAVMYSADAVKWSFANYPHATDYGDYFWMYACYGPLGFLTVRGYAASADAAKVSIARGEMTAEVEIKVETNPVSQPTFQAMTMPAVMQYTALCYGGGVCVAAVMGTGGTRLLLGTFESGFDDPVWESILITAARIVAIAYSPALSRFIALYSIGAIFYSSDGKNWTNAGDSLSSIGTGWNDVCWADGINKFVAVGANNSSDGRDQPAYSSDGITWRASETIIGYSDLRVVCWGNDRIVTCDAGGNAFMSYDAITWDANAIVSKPVRISALAFGGGKFVARTPLGFSYSSDGLEWETVPYATGEEGYYFNTLSYGDGRFFSISSGENYVAVTSEDGINWSQKPSEMSAFVSCYIPLKQCFLSLGTGIQFDESLHFTGGDWTGETFYLRMPNYTIWNVLCFGAGKFVASSWNDNFYYSTDGTTWKMGSTGYSSAPKHSICYGAPGFAAIYNYGFVTKSVDGETWKKGGSDTRDLDATGVSYWGGSAYGNGRYVVFGMKIGGSSAISAYSSDLFNWSYSTSGLSGDASTSRDISSIVFTNGVFVATCYKKSIFRSTDGANWTKYDLSSLLSSNNSIFSVNAANGKFILAQSGTGVPLLFSEDGATWYRGTTNLDFIAQSISYGNGFYVAITTSTSYRWSKDANTWYSGQMPTENLSIAVFGNGRFVAVGNSGNGGFADTTKTTRFVECRFNGNTVGFQNPAANEISANGNRTFLLADGMVQGAPKDMVGMPPFEMIRSIELDGKQECDYVMVSDGGLSAATRKKLLGDSTYHPTDQDAQFYADFDGSTNGGGISGTQFTAFSIYRLEAGEAVLRHIVNVTTDDGSVVIDASAVNGRKYTYYAFGVGSDTFVTSALISNSVELCGWDWAVLSCTEDESGVYHVEEMFLFGKNLVSGGVTNNNGPQILQNFTRYPTMQPAPQNYRSGTLQSLIGTITDCRYSDTRAVRDAIWALSTTANTLFLKNRKGDLIKIRTAGAIEMDTGDNSPLQPQTVSLPWVEVGSSEDAQIVITRADGAWAG
nr:MAG TPA: glycoside hydrolase [Caudoviricetes sp.]